MLEGMFLVNRRDQKTLGNREHSLTREVREHSLWGVSKNTGWSEHWLWVRKNTYWD